MRLAVAACALPLTAAWWDGTLPPKAGSGADTDLSKVSLDAAAAASGAVCLDGTPPAYYIRNGTASSKWYIHHEGGGWCEGFPDCVSRSTSDLGSSSKYPATVAQEGGYFSQDPATNPTMHDWNHVFLRYCDGASFSGSNATVNVAPDGTKLHFRGSLVRAAMVESLLAAGLSAATDVVVSGCSAGGLATYLHTDQWCDAVPAAKTCVGLPDSGFFLDFQDPRAEPTPTVAAAASGSGQDGGGMQATNPGNYHEGLQWSFAYQNATSGVNQDCVAAKRAAGEAEYLCMFAEHSSEHIRSPVFALQSKYDSWQTGHVLFDGDVAASVNALGANITSRTKSMLMANNPASGAFLDACHHHCGAWNTIRIDGDLVSDAFAKWYASHTDPAAKKLWNQDEAYPCDACCTP